MSWRTERAQDYVHTRLLELIRQKKSEELEAAEKKDLPLQKYDAAMKRISKAQKDLSDRHAAEVKALAKKQEPVIKKTVELLGSAAAENWKNGWNIREKYLHRLFPKIIEKYRTMETDLEAELLLHDQKNLAAFLAEWTAKIEGHTRDHFPFWVVADPEHPERLQKAEAAPLIKMAKRASPGLSSSRAQRKKAAQ